MPLETPVAFFIFNRPELTLRVFDAIARQKPLRLLVIADGPRNSHSEDDERVAMTRSVLKRVNWPCEVLTSFSETNLGCRQRMATGLSWAFEQAEELIILEDDCLPDDSFFGYCEDLLERYRHEPRVMMISGNNFYPDQRAENTYYFSRYALIWGWASWKRAWDHYDLAMTSWPAIRSAATIAENFESPGEYAYWRHMFDQQHLEQVDTWDFAWTYACMKNKGLAILPEKNLVSNLGFGSDATHTTDATSPLSHIKAHRIEALSHPATIARDIVADNWTFANVFQPAMQELPQPKRRNWLKKLMRIVGRRAEHLKAG